MAVFPAVFYAIVYVCLPTANSGLDAYGYAFDVAQGRNLLLPHHLLYNATGYGITHLLGAGDHTLQCLMAMNGIMAGICLYFAYLILYKAGAMKQVADAAPNVWRPLPMVMFLGATFGFMRFATENETYIAPLLFSLAGTWQVFEYHAQQKSRQLWLGLMLLAVAVLYHQIHVFWYAVFAANVLYTSKRKGLWPAMTSALLIAFVYIVSAYLHNENLYRFIFHDAFTNTVSLMPVLDMLKFTAINFVRTFVQVHGNVLVFAKGEIGIWPAVAAVVAAIGFFVLGWRYWKGKKWVAEKNAFGVTVIVAFGFQLLFALLSSGNAEFMVMLPCLAMVYIAGRWQFDTRPLWLAAACMFVWNVGFALLPASKYDLQGFEKTMHKLPKENLLLVSQNAIHFGNYLEYKNHKTKGLILLKSPADSDDTAVLFRQIDSALQSRATVLTDCVDYPETGSRKSILSGNANAILKDRYTLLLKDSIEIATGKVKLFRITSLK